MGKRWKFLLAAVVVSVVMAETVPRALGMVDFPIYEVNDRIGYIPAPFQSGSFLNKNEWYLNSLSMASVEEFAPSENIDDVLLIGDSIVWGGNGYRWEDRLAEQMKTMTAAQVWSVSAGSWAIVNELNYLEDHPEVVQDVDRLVFIVNEGDFGAPSSWRSPYTHPREKPISAFFYLLNKYILEPDVAPTPENLLVAAEDPIEKLHSFVDSCECSVDFWIYPTRAEVNGKKTRLSTGEMRMTLRSVLPENRIHEVIDLEGWSDDIYKDSIHPTLEGFGILAGAISEEINY
jgi:hypothetical protein